MKEKRWPRLGILVCMGIATFIPLERAAAHDPVFGLGPHTLYKGGYEIHLGALRGQSGNGEERETEYGLALKYGLTGDWVVGIELPYLSRSELAGRRSGMGDAALSTKYRFWRNDLPGAQESAAVSATAISDTGDESGEPALGSGTTDYVLGLTYGYEARKWYRWAAVRYRLNDETGGLRRGDKVLFDLVGGLRPYPTGYLEPDTVWMLELNGEYTERAELNGRELPNSGGTEIFVAPGLMWTLRNFAVKTGVQIPVYSGLNGKQGASDYRAALEFEWHFGG